MNNLRKIILIGVLFHLTIVQSNAQNIVKEPGAKTLFGNGESYGGFVGLKMKGGEVNGESALLLGGELSGTFAHKINIGIAGYGMVTGVDADTRDVEGRFFQIHMGYGGLFLEPIIANNKVVHLTVPVILGVGGAGIHRDLRRVSGRDIEDYWEVQETDAFLVIEPGLNVEINMLKFMRMNVGMSYRYIGGTDIEGISDSELSGYTASLGFKFGWF